MAQAEQPPAPSDNIEDVRVEVNSHEREDVNQMLYKGWVL